MTIYFISDLHLNLRRPESTELFYNFLAACAPDAEAIYILGDLFEFWIGDDAADATGQSEILAAIRRVTEKGVPVYFIRGNRDFLVGHDFENSTGCRILADPTQIRLGDSKVMLKHGDSMCTDDTEHQSFRLLVNDRQWQQQFLQYSVEKRLELALSARSRSALHKSMTSMEIMDVNIDAVKREMLTHNADILIHGHTHRPDIHKAVINGRQTTRFVLGDWYTQSSMLRYDSGVFQLSAHGRTFPPVRAAARMEARES